MKCSRFTEEQIIGIAVTVHQLPAPKTRQLRTRCVIGDLPVSTSNSSALVSTLILGNTPVVGMATGNRRHVPSRRQFMTENRRQSPIGRRFDIESGHPLLPLCRPLPRAAAGSCLLPKHTMNPTSLQERYPGTVPLINRIFLRSAIIVCTPAILSGYAVMAAYKDRNLVERFVNRIRSFRCIATRCDKLGSTCLAMVKLAAIRIWLQLNESTA